MILHGLLLISAISLATPVSGGDYLASLDEVSDLSSADYFNPHEYMVGYGDQIWIAFPGGVPFSGVEEAVSTIVLPVGLDGQLSIPGFAPMDVTGMNFSELQQRIDQMIRSSYGRLAISSGLARSASFEIPVTGQVNEPGIITVNGLTRLSEAIEYAGDRTAVASVSGIAVISTSGDSSFYNLNDFLINGELEANPLMHRNTRIHIYPARENIVVEGALSSIDDQVTAISPRSPDDIYVSERVVLEYIHGETPQSALQRAGGISDSADIYGCFVQRTTDHDSAHIISFDFQQEASTFTLSPGDRLVVPFADRYISVVGQVMSPMPILYSPGMPVSYYIGMAGGFTAASKQGSLKIMHRDGSEENVELSTVVPPGSIVNVPRVAVMFWQEYLTILTGVATVVISYQSLFQ